MIGETALHDLPREIIAEILIRLPPEYAIQNKEVCKTWRNILDHIIREGRINLLFEGGHVFSGCSQLYHGEYDEKSDRTIHEQLSYDALTPLGNPNVPYTNRLIVGCRRGLVCFVMNNKKLGAQQLDYDDPIYICNPLTQQTVRLPLPPKLANLRPKSAHDLLVVGFGYLYATNEYKIVRIYYSSYFCQGHVQVYTLGDNSGRWRNTFVDIFLGRYEYSHGILFDGALHWIKKTDTDIVAFDLATEKFRSFQIPTCILPRDNHHRPKLLLLGGYLSIAFTVYTPPISGRSTEIWSLKSINDPKMENDHEFTVHADFYPLAMCHPIALKDENNKVILWDMGRGTKLGHYDPKTEALEELEYGEFEVSRVIPYMKCDVSLTILGSDLPTVNWDS